MDNPIAKFIKVHHTLKNGSYKLSPEPGLGVELLLSDLQPYRVESNLRNAMAEVV